MVDNISAIEMDVFHERSAILAVENEHVPFPRGGWAALHHQTNRVGRPLRRVWHIWRNEKRLALADNVINDAIPFRIRTLISPFNW